MHRRKRLIYLAAVLLFIFSLSACSSGEIEISDAWARPGFANENSAAYFTIRNPTLQQDSLLGAASDIAASVELHASMMSGSGQNETMQMVHQDSVDVGILRKIKFEPGGLHVMLIGLSKDLEEGDSFTLTLQFETSGDIEVVIPVLQQ